VRLASGASSRAVKYRHLFDEALSLSDAEISVLTVLMLRGAQTVGELKQRTERTHSFESLAEIDETLTALAARELVAKLPRRPGQSQDRWAQLLGREGDPAAAPVGDSLEERVRHLEEEVAALRGEVIALRDRLGER
jgi:uncharacterized protein YceH (UPF0502 family)